MSNKSKEYLLIIHSSYDESWEFYSSEKEVIDCIKYRKLIPGKFTAVKILDLNNSEEYINYLAELESYLSEQIISSETRMALLEKQKSESQKLIIDVSVFNRAIKEEQEKLTILRKQFEENFE